MKRTASLLCFFFLCLLGFTTTSVGQTPTYINATGNPSFGVNIPIENGFINISNGNLHMEFPLATHKQRGALNLNEKLVYDSRIWMVGCYSNCYWWPNNIPNTPNTQAGWRFIQGNETGSVSYYQTSSASSSCFNPSGDGDAGYLNTYVNTITWADPSGTRHTFDATITEQDTNCINGGDTDTQSINGGYATDASGYSVQDDGYGQPLIKDNNGTQVYPQVIDRYGNFWSSDGNGNLIDDLGRTPVMVTQSGNTTYYDVLAANGTINNNGARIRYTVTTSPIYVSTAFGGHPDWSGTLSPVSSIQLPNGSSYSFSYDGYGELSSVTLPTGGVISYGYTNFVDSLSDKNRWVSSRTVGSNPSTTFTYYAGSCSGNCSQSAVVHKPSGDETDYEFSLVNGAWNSTIFAYTGPVSSGNQLMVVSNSYDFSNTCSGLGACTGPEYIHKTYTYTTLPQVGLQSQTQQEYSFPALGKPSASKVWDYYASGGSPSSTPARETDYAYTAPGYDIQQVTVKDSSGNPASQTTYGYTGTATATSSVIGHGSANAGGPYLHTVTNWLSGGTDPVTTYTMDDTGSVRGINDAKGNPTNFTYQCSNTYPYQVTNALSQTTTYGYDCNSGQVTSVQDPNDLAASRAGTTYAYESGAGRLHTVTTPDGGQTTYSYPSSTEVDTAVLATPDPTIAASDISDIYGRPYQHVQAGVSTETTYDIAGRISCVTNPHTVGSSSTDATCVTTYDGLDRPKLVTQPDSKTLSWSYAGNVTTSTDEAGNSWVRTSNALGQLTTVVEPGNLSTHYSYDALGNLGGVTQSGVSGETPRTRSFTYDSLSRLLTSNNPETGTICYGVRSGGNCINGYDPNGNLVAKTDARGIITSYSYDALNRLMGKSYSDGTASSCFQYDTPTYGPSTTGRLTKDWTQPGACAWGSQAPTNVLTYKQTLGYDAMGRSLGDLSCALNCQTQDLLLLKYWYDLAGNRTDLRDPVGNILTSSFDSAGRLSSVANTTNPSYPATLFSATSYGPVGLLNSTLGNGLIETRSYDVRARQVSYDVSSPGAPASSTPPVGIVSAPYNDANQTNVVAQGDTLHVQGWAASPTGGCPIASVEVDLGVTKGGPGIAIGEATTGLTGWLYNPGFTTCGFSFDDSVGDIAPGQYYVNVYATDANGQRALLINQFPITVTSAVPPSGNVDWVSAVVPDGNAASVADGGKITLSGWAIDSQMVAPVAAVKVSVDGNSIGFATLGVPRPDVVSIVGNGDSRYLYSGFVFTGTVGNLTSGQHSVYVTIYDALGQHTTPASVYPITVVTDPTALSGNLDSTNASTNGVIAAGSTLTATGWAALPGVSGCGVGQTVELWLGGILLGQTQTSGSRPDVANALGNQACINTGWTISGSVAAVPSGLYNLRVRVYDATGGSGILNSIPQIMVSPMSSTPTSVATTVPTQYSWALGYAPNGNVEYSADSVNGNWAHLYDNLNRLVASGSGAGNGLAWEYDSFGNMLSQTVTQGSGYAFEKVIASNNRVAFACYDAAGNQLQDSGCYSPSQYNYDAENRLSSSGWGTTTYIYDAEGRRVAKQSGGQVTNIYVYDDRGQNIAELNGAGGVIRREIYAGARHLATYNDAAGGGVDYALTDWIGTERARSDSSGTLCQTATSQPFGDGLRINGSCFPSNAFFTGLERDSESGLDHTQFRQLSSVQGRWMSPDPYLGSMDLTDPQSLNRYSYVLNKPLKYLDPLGLIQICGDSYSVDNDGDPTNEVVDVGVDCWNWETNSGATGLDLDSPDGEQPVSGSVAPNNPLPKCSSLGAAGLIAAGLSNTSQFTGTGYTLGLTGGALRAVGVGAEVGVSVAFVSDPNGIVGIAKSAYVTPSIGTRSYGGGLIIGGSTFSSLSGYSSYSKVNFNFTAGAGYSTGLNISSNSSGISMTALVGYGVGVSGGAKGLSKTNNVQPYCKQ